MTIFCFIHQSCRDISQFKTTIYLESGTWYENSLSASPENGMSRAAQPGSLGSSLGPSTGQGLEGGCWSSAGVTGTAIHLVLAQFKGTDVSVLSTGISDPK